MPSAISLWLQDPTVPEVLYDEERFLTDPTCACFPSNSNVFTYAIGQRDGRRGRPSGREEGGCG